MLQSFESLTGRPRRRQLALVATTACVFAWLFSFIVAEIALKDVFVTGLVADLNPYRELAEAVLDGGMPYVDVPFEHLPVSSIAIIVLGWVSSVSGVANWLVWPIAMSVCFVASALALDRFDGYQGRGFRFIVVSLPLLPLVLFRLEPWVVVLTVLGISGYMAGDRIKGAIGTIAGTLAKGWPIVVALLPWRRGHRWHAVTVAVASLLMIGLIAVQDGFRSGRAFEGIHTETIVGSCVLLFRQMTGSTLGFISVAGARYIEVPDYAVVLNAVPGLVVIGFGVWFGVRKKEAVLLDSIGIVVLGILLASPLASTQFVWWLVPFIAFAAATPRRLYIGAAIVALASVTVFAPASAIWAIEVVIRNVLLLALAVVWINHVARGPDPGTTALREHLA